MYGTEPTLCGGCLGAGRRLRGVEHRARRLYLESILAEIPIARPHEAPVSLCWECHARLANALDFRQQVKSCYATLRNYCAQSAPASIVRPPRLCAYLHAPKEITPAAIDDGTPEIYCTLTDGVKSEDPWYWNDKDEKQVKNEPDTQSVASDRLSASYSFTPSDDEELKHLIGKLDKPDVKVKGIEKKTRNRSAKKKMKSKFVTVRLSQEEMTREREALRESDAFTSAAFKCNTCVLTFPAGDALELHRKTKHSPELGTQSCPTCGCLFRSATSLQCHVARHLRRYECVACSSRHPSKRSAVQHHAERHETQGYACDYCAEKFTTEGAYRTHKKSHKDERTDIGALNDYGENLDGLEDAPEKERAMLSTSSFPCDQCDKVFRWKTSLRKHTELHRIQAGAKKRPYCDVCRLSFTTTANLQKHMKTSSKHQIQLKVRDVRALLTEEPTEPSKLDPTRMEEIRNDVTDSLTKFPCPHCDKKFQWKGNLLRHIQSHKARASGELYCAPCDRKFSSIATFQQHMKISKRHVTENEFRYMCSDCGKKFANKIRLKDHVDWEHLKVYTHTCPLCQKVFKSHTSLYLHKQVVHRKNNGDHLCDHCGKPFPNRAKLRSHIVAMHTTEQPYKCKLCPASFSWHSCLSRHVKVVHHKVKAKRKRKHNEYAASDTTMQ